MDAIESRLIPSTLVLAVLAAVHACTTTVPVPLSQRSSVASPRCMPQALRRLLQDSADDRPDTECCPDTRDTQHDTAPAAAQLGRPEAKGQHRRNSPEGLTAPPRSCTHQRDKRQQRHSAPSLGHAAFLMGMARRMTRLYAQEDRQHRHEPATAESDRAENSLRRDAAVVALAHV